MNSQLTAVHDPRDARSYWTTGRGDAASAFAKAARHSKMVRWMRVGIPIGMLSILVVTLLLAFFNPLRLLGKLPVDMSKLVVSGTKITMEAPRLSGYTKDQRAYELTARAAAQDLTKPDIVELSDIKARVEMQDKTGVDLTAVDGLYDSKGETLTLGKNIVLTSSTGYQARLNQAIVDIRGGSVVSEQPVQVDLLNGKLNANRLEIVNRGEVLRFEGGVNMTLKLPPVPDPASASAAK